MRVDRLFKDILDWVERLVRWEFKKKQPGKRLLYKRIRSFQPSGALGMLYEIGGRNTPRAIATWIYAPYRPKAGLTPISPDKLLDWHILLDEYRMLSAKERKSGGISPIKRIDSGDQNSKPGIINRFAAIPRESKRKIATHSITIVRAGHWIYEGDSSIEFEFVYSADLDFGSLTSRAATNATWLLALLVARRGELINPLTWNEEVEEIRAIVLGEPTKYPQTKSAEMFRNTRIPAPPSAKSKPKKPAKTSSTGFYSLIIANIIISSILEINYLLQEYRDKI